MRRLVVSDDAAHRLGGAVPSPAAAFLLAVIALPALFWLVMLKRTTVYTAPEEWLMSTVVPAIPCVAKLSRAASRSCVRRKSVTMSDLLGLAGVLMCLLK